MKNKARALYIHVPFCHSICHYCDFLKVLYKQDWADQYIKTVKQELGQSPTKYISIYLGGGSPSALNHQQLDQLLGALQENKADNCEFCIEINPEDMDEIKLNLLVKYGINRVSIGVQTFDDELLKQINRHHNGNQVRSIIGELKERGITNITCDLIFGIPNQTTEIINKDLDILINELKVPHISTYALLIEPHTYFDIKKIAALDDDIQAQQYNLVSKKLMDNGYERYEVSNFARPGYESKHNLTYWHAEEYRGIGPGASGYEAGVRYEISKKLNAYLRGEIIKDEHLIDIDEQEYEFIILSLRLKEGLSFDKFKEKFNQDFLAKYQKQVKNLLNKGLVEIKKDHLIVVASYVFVMNLVLEEFIPD